MEGLKSILYKKSKSRLFIVGVLVIFLLSALLLWYGNATSTQAQSALVAGLYFDGEYRIEDGEWQPIVEGEHIPATKGDVTLRGNFHMLTPYGEYIGIYTGGMEPIAFYTDHINLTFYEAGFEPWVIDVENPMYGDSVCCACWSAYSLVNESEDPIEIRIHNPHNFGNENAIDEMLRGVAIWGDMSFEKGILNDGEPQRNSGMLLILFAIVFLGIALFSSLIHIKNSRIIWLLGLVILFAGLYLTYSADGVAFWSESTFSNTTILGSAMIFYMLFLSMIVVCILKQTSGAASVAVQITAVIDAVIFIIPIVSDVRFYDTWGWWAVAQICAGIALAVCLVTEFSVTKGVWRWLYIGAVLPFIAFIIDVISTCIGTWSGGEASRYVFIALFAIAAVMVLRFIPHNINAATKARELEMEKTMLNAQLAESRISTMMSQIRPHFIYNTLGSIEQLCKLDPPKAGDLVHNFAKYLRGNFGELDNPKPILMSQEMEHVHHYISIENVRFPDMTFTFEMNSDDFRIPALTVQPIVENAIKHGLMKLSKGGSISVVSYETDTEYRISVVDDGVGFDTGALMDERKHVGLRNIRERLKVMVNGTLEIESTVGEGTRVLNKNPEGGQRMIAIAVDDEVLMLGALVSAIEESDDIREVNKFSDCDEALEFVKAHPIDIAFLDINMRGMGGLALAERIIEARPSCKVVFCTGYEEYAVPAFKLHASGYLMKPVSAEDVQGEIDNIKGMRQKEKVLTVKCFGNFEVYAKDEKLVFKRLKSKELFAFLIDRNGAGMTAKQICAALFPDDTDDSKNASYLRQLVMDLKNTLKAVGAENVLCHETPCYRVDTSLIKCDYMSYLETGKPEFYGEYMTQYSWAEETCAMLLFKK